LGRRCEARPEKLLQALMQLLGRAKELQPELIVVMVTAFSDVDTAVRAMQRGALLRE
jgi:DNA-binding NtrC family response regulator